VFAKIILETIVEGGVKVNRLREIHKKNQFMLLLILISVVLGIWDNIFTVKGWEALILLSLGGSGLLGLLGYLVFAKKAISYVMYIIVVGIQSLVLAFIVITPGVFSYMTIYLSLFIIAVFYRQSNLLDNLLHKKFPSLAKNFLR